MLWLRRSLSPVSSWPTLRSGVRPLRSLRIRYRQVLGTIFQSFWGQPLAGSFVELSGLLPGAVGVGWGYRSRPRGRGGRHPLATTRRWRDSTAAAVVAIACQSSFNPSMIAPEQAPIGRQYVVDSIAHSPGLLSGDARWCRPRHSPPGLPSGDRRCDGRSAPSAQSRWCLDWSGSSEGATFRRYAAHVRAESFVWPAVSTAVGLAAFATLAVIERRSEGKRWSPTGSNRWHSGSPGRS